MCGGDQGVVLPAMHVGVLSNHLQQAVLVTEGVLSFDL
jgi:hypothetical protein